MRDRIGSAEWPATTASEPHLRGVRRIAALAESAGELNTCALLYNVSSLVSRRVEAGRTREGHVHASRVGCGTERLSSIRCVVVQVRSHSGDVVLSKRALDLFGMRKARAWTTGSCTSDLLVPASSAIRARLGLDQKRRRFSGGIVRTRRELNALACAGDLRSARAGCLAIGDVGWGLGLALHRDDAAGERTLSRRKAWAESRSSRAASS